MSEDNVVILPVETTLDLPAERILTAAIEADLPEVFVLGKEQDGRLYFAGNTSDLGSALLLMERARAMIVRIVEE